VGFISTESQLRAADLSRTQYIYVLSSSVSVLSFLVFFRSKKSEGKKRNGFFSLLLFVLEATHHSKRQLYHHISGAMDAKYLRENVNEALIEALASMAVSMPDDSVEYVGKYLIQYVERKALKAKVVLVPILINNE
jgi:hypothetical protein